MSWNTSERRKFVRVHFPCEIFLTTPQNKVILAHTENISAGGIRVLLENNIEPSSIVRLTLYKITTVPILCQGRIIWVFTRQHPREKNVSVFDTGIEFHQIAKKDLLQIEKFILNLIYKQK